MKMKLTTLLFGLLLAVGWTSHASAQALPQGGYAERLGLNDVTATMSVQGIVKAHKKKVASFQTMPMSTEVSTQESTPMMAPKRVTGVSSVVKNKAYYQQFKYNWTDDETGETHTNVDPTEPASNPYQIYELLRFVYGNPNFPGPSYSAYTPNYQREDEVYYGAINGGWDITAGSGGAAMTTHDITITASSYYASFKSITVYDMDGNVLTSWDAQTAIDNAEYTSYTATDGTRYRYTMPGWSSDYYMGILNAGTESNIIYVGYLASGTTTPGTITIPYSLLNGQTQVRVVINANHDYEEGDEGDANQTITVNGEEKALGVDFADFTWTPIVAEQPEQGAFVQGTVVPPYDDGYTVVVVALKDRAEMQLATEEWPANSSHFETKAQLIEYFGNNIEYVRLLTDGLRIGSETDHTSGTVFNCDGRLNRFFFLGKGQARKKAPRIQAFINQGGTIRFEQFTANSQYYTNVNYQDWFGEDVAFEEMYEQFSPTSTTVSDESQTLDLFDKLREGNVYDVQHDCGSVMQAEHEFSLAGKNGTEHFPFSGLNFFVPDYRLLFWTTDYSKWGSTTYTVDGRDNVPYERANTSYTTPEGSHGSYFSGIQDNVTGDYWSGYTYPTWYSAWSAYYAVYNKTYAPKIGIYRITLDAVATFVGDATNPDHSPSNHNYNVTLTWVSSLDQMSGHTVPQTYTMYLVDENGNRTQLEPEGVKFYDINGNLLDENNQNPFHVTQAVYAVPQNEHSYTIEYQVDGVADQGPEFHATSNRASVVIPGWEDFVGLKLDHHESDFDPEFEGKRVNFYRNFVAMVNEDIYNGLTISKITGYNEENPSTPLEKMDKFNLYRFLPDAQGDPTAETKVATITFDQASADQVHFNVAYENQEIENYTLQYKDGNQTYTVNNAYSLENLNIPTSGWVRVKGNGDIVIWPNRYTVNIKSITVKNGNTTITSWNASSASIADQNPNLPTSPYKWETSPGSDFLPYVSESNEQVCYMEGGGYLYIPGVLKTYPNATVVIEAFGEAGNVNRISVNDASKDILATSGGAYYTWPAGDDPLSPNAAPRRAVVENTSSLVFTAKCNGSGTADDGAVWTVTSDAVAGEQDFDNERGIHYGSNSRTTGRVGYIQLATDQIPGTITKIVVEASRASSGTGYVSTTVGGNAFGGNAQTLTGSNAAYTFEGSATGPVVVRVFKNQSARYALYVKSITVYYETEGEDTPTEGGLLRLHVLFADQLKEEIPDDNSHPDAYGYILRYEPESGNKKESGTVRVNIQKTDCEVMGYHTLGQIDRDTDRKLAMDVLTADVEYNLSSTNDLLNYYYLQGAKDRAPELGEDYLSQLHRQEDFTYREMLETSPEFDQVVSSGEHHYFNSTDEPIIGEYGNSEKYVSYAPSVSTWGIQRRYYELDGKDNTYGGPIWKTAVGKAELNSVTAERQKNAWNSVNWGSGAEAASLYILNNIDATGYLPPSNLTKVEFEPYMFRVFVESKNGKLRPYKTVANADGSGEHLEAADGELTEADMKGPKCVWSGYVKYGTVPNPNNPNNPQLVPIDDPENGVEINYSNINGPFTYHKDKVDRPGGSSNGGVNNQPWDQDTQNAMFGALDAMTTQNVDGKDVIIEDDLKFFVRFYFAVKGEIADHTPWTRVEGSRSGNGAESAGKSGDSATAVNEIHILGEIVSQTYFNVQGMESDKPFQGVNIVVTRFSDGTTSVSKVVR